jgi:hypothetical protein
MSEPQDALQGGTQNPISRPGLVTTNAVVDNRYRQLQRSTKEADTLCFGNWDEMLLSVLPDQLCFAFVDPDHIELATSSTDDTPMFSNFLNFPGKTYEQTYKKVRFIGISSGNGAMYDEQNRKQELGFAPQTHGKKTLDLNSDHFMPPGAWVMWEWPTKREKVNKRPGSPYFHAKLTAYDPEKHEATAERLLKFHDDYLEKIKGDLKKIQDFKNPNAEKSEPEKWFDSAALLYWQSEYELRLGNHNREDKKLHLANQLKAINKYNEEMKSRIIGKCEKGGLPGHTIDVMLGHY